MSTSLLLAQLDSDYSSEEGGSEGSSYQNDGLAPASSVEVQPVYVLPNTLSVSSLNWCRGAVDRQKRLDTLSNMYLRECAERKQGKNGDTRTPPLTIISHDRSHPKLRSHISLHSSQKDANSPYGP